MKHGVVFKFGEMSNLTNINAVEFECDFACARNSGGARVFFRPGQNFRGVAPPAVNTHPQCTEQY